MVEREPGTLMDRIRSHARAQVAKTSLRKVAKSAGVKVGATKKFIDGSVPYERNARLWKRWYQRQLREGVAGVPDDALPTEDARSSLDVLLWSLPREERTEGFRRMVAALHGVFVDMGRTPPRWALELADATPDEPDPEGDDDDEEEDD